jgi:hypothetical protein
MYPEEHQQLQEAIEIYFEIRAGYSTGEYEEDEAEYIREEK